MPVLHVLVKSGKIFKAQDLVGKGDPYVMVKYNGNQKKTDVKKNTQNPTWNQDITFDVVSGGDKTLVFEVYDEDQGHNDDLVGTSRIEDVSVFTASKQKKSLDLSQEGESVGSIDIEVWIADGKAPAPKVKSVAAKAKAAAPVAARAASPQSTSPIPDRDSRAATPDSSPPSAQGKKPVVKKKGGSAPETTGDVAAESAGGTIPFSTSALAQYPPESMIDGDDRTFWITSGTFPQEFLLAFASTVHVRRIKMSCTNIKNVVITAEDDNGEENQIAEENLENTYGNMQLVNLEVDADAKKLRFTINQSYHEFISIHALSVH